MKPVLRKVATSSQTGNNGNSFYRACYFVILFHNCSFSFPVNINRQKCNTDIFSSKGKIGMYNIKIKNKTTLLTLKRIFF